MSVTVRPLKITDSGCLVWCTQPDGTEVVVPAHAATPIPLQTTFWVRRGPGAGPVALSKAAGVTINAPPGHPLTITSYDAELELTKVALPDTWNLKETGGNPINIGGLTVESGAGVPTRTDRVAGSLDLRTDHSQLWRWVEDYAVATSAANIVGTDLKSSGATNVVTLAGFDPANTVRFSKPLAADSDGQLTWDAYSLWPDDSGTTPTPSPVPGETWSNAVSIYGNNGGSDVLLFTAVFPGFDTTGANAFAALAAQMPVSFTGYATYKVVGGIDTNPSDNRGGLSILVEELTPGWVLMSDLTSIRLNGVEIAGSPRWLDVVDANGALVAASDGLGGVSLTLNTDDDPTLAADSDAIIPTQAAVKAYVDAAGVGGGSGVAAGTSFPGSPSNRDLFYRTDRDILYFYDLANTRWLSVTQYYVPIAIQDQLNPRSATTADVMRTPLPYAGVYDFLVEKFQTSCFLSAAGGTASNYFTITLNRTNVATSNVLATQSLQSDTNNQFTNHNVTVNTVVSNAEELLSVSFTLTGSCGMYGNCAVYGRVVG